MANHGGKMSWLCNVLLKHLRPTGLVGSFALLVSLTIVVFGATYIEASKKMRPLTHAEVSHVWIGLSEDELYMFRLSLAPDGKGFGAYSFLDDEPHIFRVSSWKYLPSAIQILIEPVGQSPLIASSLNGEIVGARMHLRMSGKGWSRSLSLRREEDLAGRWNRIKEAMGRRRIKE